MSSAFFKAYGLSNSAIGLFSVVGLAWTLKLFWSPLVDLYSTRRQWMMITQALLVAASGLLVLATALPEPVYYAIVVMVLMAVLSATQDIAIDGYYLEALDDNDQARYSGLRVSAYRVAMILAAGPLLFVSGLVNWTVGFGCAAVLLGLVFTYHYWFLPVQGRTDAADRQPFSLGAFAEAFTTYLQQPRIVLLIVFILVYKTGDNLLFAMTTPFLMDAGISVADIGLIAGTIGKIATIAGSIAGGFWMARAGTRIGVWTLSFAMNIPILLYVWLAHHVADGTVPSLWLVGFVHSSEQFASGLGTAAYMVLLMRTCTRAFRAAHYAIATGIMALGMTGSGMASGYLTEDLGYINFFWVSFAATVPGLVMMWFLPFGRMAADVEANEEPAPET